ncbi:helix-turn-helix domain-containing protein [Nocardia huaxiensis]|uniref:Helix-turn-helix domain-containing protein n=1 Tax=Nocardia huaxiensis TaxID=2755382 RepID=A0A7D6VEX7_9NOCA|nr:helix-turn-helix domain-containing protein [Nocardia huaxiensis]QLY28050.1 helix-turn-helix domain-containing protein [Nocardia huaxiensis]
MHRRDLDAEATAWISAFAESLLEPERLAAFTDRMDDEIAADLPAVADDAALRRDLHASTRDALRGYFRNLLTEDPRDIPIPPASRDLFRALAQRGHELPVLLRIFPAGQRVAWQAVMDAVFDPAVDAALRQPILNRLWNHVNRVTGAWTEQAVSAYFEEIQQRLQGALARRVDTVHALLRGENLDPETATLRLGHNLHGEQTGLVLWSSDLLDEAAAMPALETFAREIATAAGTTRPLTLPCGPRTLWVWLVTSPVTDLRGALTDVARNHPGLRAATGVPAAGPTGFRTSHSEAVAAQTLAIDTGTTTQVTDYRDVELVICLASNPTAMRSMVTRELAGLSGNDSAARRLRETVLAYLEHGSSARAAEALDVHKNTVLYRLQQAEDLLGHPIDDRKLHLEIALRLAAVYGDALLDARSG